MKKFGILVSLILLVSSCTNMNLAKMQKLAAAGQYDKAAEKAIALTESASDSDKLLWSLEAGNNLRSQKKFRQSTEYFDQAESLMKQQYIRNFGSNAYEHIQAVIINDTMIDYPAYEYEAIMANTYKALNFMALNDWDNARIEFNRTLDRQRRATERFANEISSQKDALDKQQQSMYGAENFNAESNRAKIFRKIPRSNNQWQAYPDFVNPFATYAAGLFLLHCGEDNADFDKAQKYLERTSSMNPSATMLKELANSKSAPADGTIDIIYENGLTSSRKEFKINLPLFAFDKDTRVLTSGIALPLLQEQAAATPELLFTYQSGRATSTKVADMDRVTESEYKKRLPGIITRTLLSAAWKTAAQYKLLHEAEKKKKKGENYDALQISAIGMSLFQTLTNNADLRSWNSLPKSFHIARITRPTDGKITISNNRGQKLLDLSVPNCRRGILYLKKSSKQSPMNWHFITTKK